MTRMNEFASFGPDDMRRLATENFDKFCSGVVAEALGYMTPDVGAALAEEGMIGRWIDALNCVVHVSSLSLDRATYEGRGGKNVNKIQRLTTQLADLRRRRQTAEFTDHQRWSRRVEILDAPVSKTMTERAARRATRSGLLDPASAAVKERVSMSWADFMAEVGRDVNYQIERDALLRHPYVLERWQRALAELGKPPRRLLGVGYVDLEEEDMTGRGLDKEGFFERLNARRFLLALQQREAECVREQREVALVVAQREALRFGVEKVG